MIRCNQIFCWPCDKCRWLKAVGSRDVISGRPSEAKWLHSNEISRREDWGGRKTLFRQHLHGAFQTIHGDRIHAVAHQLTDDGNRLSVLP